MSSTEISRTLRTIQHLRLSQLIARLRCQLEKKSAPKPERYRFAGSGAPQLRGDLPKVPRVRSSGSAIADLERGVVKQLNVEHEIGFQKPDWRLGPCTAQRLWAVTLHYQRWLSQAVRNSASDSELKRAGELCRHYLSDWIARCGLEAVGSRELAWNSYAIATRITEWISVYSTLGRERLSAGSDFELKFLQSLYQQAAYLHSHIEYDLRANHLMRDAVGLAWAGRFFTGDAPRRWLETATCLALEQCGEQVLADGGHFERSPMYHLEVMQDIFMLARLIENDEARKEMTETWRRMSDYAVWMRHPDGNIPLFNDAAFNGTAAPDDVLALNKELGIECSTGARHGGKFFPDSGMVVWHGTPWSIFFDVGPLGPDYQPGHGHADTLSLECSYKGARLFVDPGTHSYDLDKRRSYDRSTAAHNTICIDDENSSEMWHIFRVGRRARSLDVYADFTGGGLSASAGHDGYTHLAGRPRHFRRVQSNADRELHIEDRIEGGGKHRITGGWLLDPEWAVTRIPNGWDLVRPTGKVRVTIDGPPGMKCYEQSCLYHPEFGLERQTTRLNWVLENTALPVTVKSTVE
jgi:uncharacterized heparinase superfamily protein